MRLEVFPAGDGDCFLLSYGAPARHLLVDGGRKGAYRSLRPRLAELAAAGAELSLFVLTHIDADHIEGVLAFAEDDPAPIRVGEVWYNGFDQMSAVEVLGEQQGDDFSDALRRLAWPWNTSFEGRAVQVEARRERFVRDGLALTLLSPDGEKLREMRRRWDKWRTKQAAAASAEAAERAARGIPDHLEIMGPKPMPSDLDVPTLSAPTRHDPEAPNGSSIAFLAEADERRVLLTGDAHPDLLERTLQPLAAQEGGRLKIDLLKVSHHGSAGNTTADMLALLDCRAFLFSTNGSHHGHPDPETVARVLESPAQGPRTLYFNYASRWTTPWDDHALQARYNYRCVYGEAGRLVVEV